MIRRRALLFGLPLAVVALTVGAWLVWQAGASRRHTERIRHELGLPPHEINETEPWPDTLRRWLRL